jgi:AhpD family alkylhydroperoxidase
MPAQPSAPRIAPGSPAQIGRLNYAIARGLGAAFGGGPPNVFTTLARNRSLFRAWLRFAGKLMPGGKLRREQTELVILRVAHNCDCEYEVRYHERMGRVAGLSADEIDRAGKGPDEAGWRTEQELVLRAADEMHDTRTISDDLWGRLRERFTEPELIELCLLIGHYEMLAMTLNALAVEPDPPAGEPPRVLRLAQGLARRRRRAGEATG